MVKLYSDGQYKDKIGEFGKGQHVMYGYIRNVEVDEHETLIIHRGKNIGGPKTWLLNAGQYPDLNSMPGLSWLTYKGRGTDAVIEVGETSFEKRELLRAVWWQKGWDGRQLVQNLFLQPGELDCHRHFPNDRIENIIVPGSGVATVHENDNFGGRHFTLQPGHHKLGDVGLYMTVSSIRFALDEWEELSTRLGEVRNRRNQGTAVVAPFRGTGAPGDEVERYVVLGKVRTRETNWHASASVTVSQTVKVGGQASVVQSETAVAATVEAGGGASESDGESRDVGMTIRGRIGESGRIEGDVIAQFYEADQVKYRRLKNLRTGQIVEQEGVEPVERYEADFAIRHGEVTESHTEDA